MLFDMEKRSQVRETYVVTAFLQAADRDMRSVVIEDKRAHEHSTARNKIAEIIIKSFARMYHRINKIEFLRRSLRNAIQSFNK